MFPLNVKKKIVVHTENQCINKYSPIIFRSSECDQLFVKMSAIYKIDCKKICFNNGIIMYNRKLG